MFLDCWGGVSYSVGDQTQGLTFKPWSWLLVFLVHIFNHLYHFKCKQNNSDCFDEFIPFPHVDFNAV